ncbi:MAG: type VI secretion system protein TssA [Burkholderiales bacterium]
MSALDVESLLSEVRAEEPCGPNLEYDPAFIALEKVMEGKPEVQYGDTVVAAEPPDWKEARRLSLDLLGRTRDLRVGVHLTRALLQLDGWDGFADGLALLDGLIDRRWATVHPQLDPDDGNDPTMRVNTLAALCDAGTFLRDLRDTPLVASRVHGRFSLRDVEMALDEVPPPRDRDKPSMATIDGAFMDADAEGVRETAAVIERARSAAVSIETRLTSAVGASNAQDFSDLVRLLTRAGAFVAERAGGGSDATATDAAADAGDAVSAVGSDSPAAVQRIAGEITGRDDVVRMLGKICDFYAKAEPSSPVPILLRRAQRLVPMSFMDIVRDLAPEGLSQVERIRGEIEGGEGESS